MAVNSITTTAPDRPDHTSARKHLSAAHVVFFVVGAAAPLTAIVGSTPPAFAVGQGPVVAGAFLLIGALYLLFSVGFTAMSRHVGGAGGFFVYLVQGLGRTVGLGGAATMIATYTSIQVAIYALFGVFLADMVQALGWNALPWWFWSLLAVAATWACGRRSINFSGNLLAFFMLLEVAILLVLDVAILVHGGGPEGVNLRAFDPHAFLTPGLAVAIMFIVGSFVGFEATTIFAEEVERPAITIPRATYAAVLMVTLFYAFSAWCITLYYGADKVSAAAAANFESFYFNPTRALLGSGAVGIMRVLLEVSLFACVLSLHSSISRYLFALGRDRVLPATFAGRHPVTDCPTVSGTVQSASVALLIAFFAMCGIDPYGVIFSWMSVLGVVGIISVQVLVCLAIIRYFRRNPDPGAGVFTAVLAPTGAALGLCTVLCLLLANLPMLSGSGGSTVYALPVVMLVIGLAGSAWGTRLRRRHPRVYANLGKSTMMV